MAVLILLFCGSCGLCPAKCGPIHTHTHTFWQRKLGSLSPSISKAPPRRDWLLFLAAWKKRKLYDVYFPLVLFDSSFVVGEVCSLRVTSVYSTGSCYCMLLFGLFVRLTDCLSMLAVSSTHLIENAVICSCQMSEGRTNERGSKEENMPAWSVVLFWCAFNILSGI